jgi:tetratricopeptide (TPR) repeat protein
MRKFLAATAALFVSIGAASFGWAQNMPGHVLGSPTGGGMSAAPLPPGSAGSDDYEAGLRAIRHEEYEQAITFLERAFTTHSHSAVLLNDLGLAHRKLGQYSTSMGFIQQALKEDPNDNDAHENLGELYLNLHDVASAQGQLAELTRLCPSGCDDRDTLTKSIAAFQASSPAAASNP